MPSNWLEEIYEERKQELFRFLYVILGETQAAEDASQEELHGDFFYMEMIAELSDVEREIVSLKIIAGLTHKEIARVLHMTTASVKKRYERALTKLKAKYKEA